MVNALLELVGFACLVLFAYVVWPPAALLVAGVALIAVAVVRERAARPAGADRPLRPSEIDRLRR